MTGRVLAAVFVVIGGAVMLAGFANALFVDPQSDMDRVYRVASALLGVGGLLLLAQAAILAALARIARLLAERPAAGRYPSEPRGAGPQAGTAERTAPRLVLGGARQPAPGEHPLRRSLSGERQASDRKDPHF